MCGGLREGFLEAERGCTFLGACPAGNGVIVIVEIGVDWVYATLWGACILGKGEEPELCVG